MSKRFRGDIEGLRAIAVLTVVLYHIDLAWLPGGFVGVDIFFVISGFLITGLLVREVERDGRVSLSRFYARRFKRLLPASATVIVATMVASYLFLPVTRWKDTAFDAVASAFYVINWRLADRAVDYSAEDDAVSPLQHFWSLAVEEQFYIVWPLLIILVAVLVRRGHLQMRPAMFGGLLLIFVPSLAYSVYWTQQSPDTAYFITTTRLWELALGGLVAIAVPVLNRMRPNLAAALTWAGLAGIVASVLLQDDQMPWPSYYALLPIVASAAVIAGGPAAGARGAGFLLDRSVMRWFGGLSYSLYLWHWPMIVIYEAWSPGEESTLELLPVAVASLAAAWVTHHVIENPVRFSKVMESTRNALAAGVALTIVGVVAGFTLNGAIQVEQTPVAKDAKGAQVLGEDPRGNPAGDPVDSVEAFAPSLTEVEDDNANEATRSCDQDIEGTDPASCTFGDPEGETVVAMIGNSKTRQWIPVMDEIGKERGWRIESFTKSACEFTAAPTRNGSDPLDDYPECDEWNRNVVRTVTEDLKPDRVFTVLDTLKVAQESEDVPADELRTTRIEGVQQWWRTLTDAGIDVAVLTAGPRLQLNIPDCVGSNEGHLTRCAVDRDKAYSTVWSVEDAEAAVDGVEGVGLVDMNGWVCPGEQCAPIIGDVLVYYDTHHVTATYTKTMRPFLEPQLAKAWK
ncbi:acyltransferase family protein [Aeromicrobium sp. IC_218]|uniref:acyltransferase family protein n=1 Tax=Aeromicrobium sp. IC_218 TaxID=2545468 RepID=UPI00103904F9|nr:acyltransferase family protein [Aeromicrobium sp. IC_218]TCI97373.1 acyltransferase [Aeromicrobium sp. IC_218]